MATKAAEQILPYQQEDIDGHAAARANEVEGALRSLGEAEETGVVLSLDSLMQDERGEIVLYNDSNLRTIAIATDVAKVGDGVAQRHLTKSGENVTGFRFIAFANGVKLFYQDGLRLEVRPAGD